MGETNRFAAVCVEGQPATDKCIHDFKNTKAKQPTQFRDATKEKETVKRGLAIYLWYVSSCPAQPGSSSVFC